MKKLILISLTIIMFFFKNSSVANYEKVFYDFKIESIRKKGAHNSITTQQSFSKAFYGGLLM